MIRIVGDRVLALLPMSDRELLVLADVMLMLSRNIINGGRLDLMCGECGGDDGSYGGSTEVTHAPDCAYVALLKRVDALLGTAK